jgi:hypothetical protein
MHARVPSASRHSPPAWKLPRRGPHRSTCAPAPSRPHPVPKIVRWLRAAAARDTLIVDTSPSLSSALTRGAIAGPDLLIVPIVPEPLAARRAQQVLDVLEALDVQPRPLILIVATIPARDYRGDLCRPRSRRLARRCDHSALGYRRRGAAQREDVARLRAQKPDRQRVRTARPYRARDATQRRKVILHTT